MFKKRHLSFETVSNNTVATPVAGLSGPNSVAVDASGNVYIADTGNNAIKEWTPANNKLIPLVSSGLDYPLGVAEDSAGNVYIADTLNYLVKKWTATNRAVSILVSSGLYHPDDVAVDAAGMFTSPTPATRRSRSGRRPTAT